MTQQSGAQSLVNHMQYEYCPEPYMREMDEYNLLLGVC